MAGEQARGVRWRHTSRRDGHPGSADRVAAARLGQAVHRSDRRPRQRFGASPRVNAAGNGAAMGGRLPVAILGSGNIGTDLLYKLRRSTTLEPVIVAGIDPYSEGLALARELGVATASDGIDGLLREAAHV